MKFESKYNIGDKFILTGCPCIIISVQFKLNCDEIYQLQWASPFGERNSYLSKTELDNCIEINNLINKEGHAKNSKDTLEIYDRIWNEWVKGTINVKN